MGHPGGGCCKRRLAAALRRRLHLRPLVPVLPVLSKRHLRIEAMIALVASEL